MNLIYFCVFNNSEYIKLLNLCLNSIVSNSKLNEETTDIAIFTSSEFEPLILKELSKIPKKMNYLISTFNEINNIFDTTCYKLLIFNYINIYKYKKILYLDTDILINSDINILFDLDILDDKIYTLEENTIDGLWYGSQFFDFSKYDKNISAFTTGIMYFRNSSTIKQLFKDILNHIFYCLENDYKFIKYLDQPFVVYNSIVQNKYNNQLLKKYAENNPQEIKKEKIIYHFPGFPGDFISKYYKMKFFLDKIENGYLKNINFITLTTTGYIDYTLNCLESLKNINSKISPIIYCIGKEGYNKLTEKSYNCILIDDENNSAFQTYKNDKWSSVTFYKFRAIYDSLLKNDFVCFFDGDIVYENDFFHKYLIENIEEYDMLVQKEWGIEEFCTGFMFIKSNIITINLFNPKNIEECKNDKNWDDQMHLNNVKNKIRYKELPLELFSNGNYYYENNKNINPYLIHFNWVIGNEKKEKMKLYNKWYLDKN